jgi:hypothetical protein
MSRASNVGVENWPRRFRSAWLLWASSSDCIAFRRSSDLSRLLLMALDVEEGEIIDAVFPHPVDAFGCLITEIAAVEVTTQEEVELH